MRLRHRWSIAIPAIVTLWLTASAAPAALPRRPESIQSFLQRLPTIKVDKDGVRIRVEGRFERSATVGNGHAIKLKKCDVRFFSKRALPTLRNGADVIQVTGQLFRNELGQPVVLVTAVETLPSDLNWVRRVRSQWKTETVEDLVELATWARKRAAFYEDPELAREADSLFFEAIDRQRKGLQPDDFAGRFVLAEQARRYGLPPVLQWELLHEGFVIRARSLIMSKATAKELQDLATDIARELPGAEDSVSLDAWKERAAYWAKPLAVYQSADEGRRRTLHRLLYGQVMLAAIEARFPTDGSRGLEAAQEIQRALPEAVDEAERQRLAAMQFRFDHLAEADRKQMLELAEMYRVRNQHQKSRDVIRTWLTKREERLRPLGGAGLVRLARDVWETTQDRFRTERLLREAVPLLKNADPSSIEMQDLRNLFGQLGYVQRDGRWVRADGAAARPSQPEENALIRRGMPAAEVLRKLGQPTRRTRIVARKRIVELWLYPTVGLAVRLVRDTGQPNAVVDGFHQLRSR
ncbi:MAG: hypothetical protein D6725_07935 [Planctomycetota bacterium]|nr:MAG: hypothetical protein D6725_07935 [Planctomycetota bacterium]